MAPDIIGAACFPEWWNKLKKYKFEHEWHVNDLTDKANDLDPSPEKRHDSCVTLANHKKL